MRYRWVTVFLLSSLGGIATSPWDHMRCEHSWETIPDNWESLGLPTADTMIDLYIALKPYRENALVDALNEVSDPRHPRHVPSTIHSLRIFSCVSLLRYRYGMHLSREQVADIVAPHPDTVQLVHSWLEHHRVTSSSVSVTHGGSFLTVTGVTVSQANDLLGASYQLYTHTKTNETIVRTLGYSLPVVLHGHVQTVAPTTFFSSPLTQWQTSRKRPGVAAVRPGKSPSRRDDADVTLAFLRWLYSTVAYVPSAMDRNKVGVTGYNQEYPSPADLTSYMRKYRPDGIDATFTCRTEANINIQLSEGMTYPTPQIFYSTEASPNGDYLLAWLNAVLSKQNVPQTITTSYGFFENVFPKSYAMQVCYLIAQLGARGTSVLFASGDDGVGGGDCTRFTPVFPATCPYVTAIGGTMSFRPEVAASLSGGGFSEYFVRPGYQQQAVSTFLDNLGQQYSSLYKPRHPRYFRAGEDDPVFPQRRGGIRERNKLLNASASLIPPSSLRRPSSSVALTAKVQIVSGIISLLNDYRLSQGKPPLGFLNPWLYGGGLNGLNDIVSGSNPGCNTDGFSAIVGWDPVTGLGTPDFLRLMHILDPGSSNPPE
ncbi:subtilisin-like protein [Lactarius deliciosus]|nr:subtilisin-like protein [Lactarius deliciosus]